MEKKKQKTVFKTKRKSQKSAGEQGGLKKLKKTGEVLNRLRKKQGRREISVGKP